MRTMPTLLMLSAGLLALTACEPGVYDDEGLAASSTWGDDEDFESEPLTAEDMNLVWDDPGFMPDVDRWAPDGTPIKVPLGTSVGFNSARATWQGESANDSVGISVAAVGDMNGDGRGEVGIASQYGSGSGSGDGAVYMNKSRFQAGNKRIDTAKGRWYGETGSALENVAGRRYMSSMNSTTEGDLNGTTGDEMLAGARSWDNPTDTWKVNSGAAYVITWADRGSNALPSGGTRIDGIKANDFAGAGLDIVGDINGDGNVDVAIGATGADDGGSESGAIYLIYGPITAATDLSTADAVIAGESAGDAAGNRIRGIGDFDGDGADDFAVGVRGRDHAGNTDSGSVYIIYGDGAFPSDLNSADVILRGQTGSSQAGNQVAEVGDINGDGYDDMIAGALGQGGLGAAYLILGNNASTGNIAGQAETTFTGQVNGDQFGAGLAAGDVNRDGDMDIIVSANRQSSNDKGAVYVYLNPGAGVITANDADSKLVGQASDDRFGAWIDVVEQEDTTFRDVLVVGASRRASNDKGTAYIFEF